MNSHTNGMTHGRAEPSLDLVIARDGGLWLVGRPNADGLELTPVFELHVQVIQHARGVQFSYGAQPLLLIPSMDKWKLSSSANVWPLKGQSVESQIREAVKNAQAMLVKMRLGAAGIEHATELPKIGGR